MFPYSINKYQTAQRCRQEPGRRVQWAPLAGLRNMFILTAIIGIASMLPSFAIAADLLLEDTFDEVSGTLLRNHTSGIGWSGPWSTGNRQMATQPTCRMGSLTYSGLSTSPDVHGQHGTFYAASDGINPVYAIRPINVLVTNDGSTYWFVFEQNYNITKFAIHWQLMGLTTDAAGTINANLVTIPSGYGGYAGSCTGNGVVLCGGGGVNHLMVFKIDTDGNAAHSVTVTWYVDPILANPVNTWTAKTATSSWYLPVRVTAFGTPLEGRVSSANTCALWLDNIRLAHTIYGALGISLPITTN